MANPEHLEIVKQGIAEVFEWREKNPNVTLDLTGADLSGLDFDDIYLNQAELSNANLSKSNLTAAFIHATSLIGAKLNESEFYRAVALACDLIHTDLTNASLFGAHLRLCNLSHANLQGASLETALMLSLTMDGAAFSGSIFGWTSISDCDLSKCLHLENVEHQGPSSIGLDTLIKTFRGAGNRWTAELITFFLGAGVPREVLDDLPRIISEVKYYSCFIAYGEPDRSFAEQLHADLGTRGVSRWMYAMDSTPGEQTWGEIIKNRREADKFIVLCSAQGLIRDGVLKEIEEQMDEDPNKITPISLDDTWKQPGFRVMRATRDLKPFLLERNYADFGEGRNYEQSLQRLLRALGRRDA